MTNPPKLEAYNRHRAATTTPWATGLVRRSVADAMRDELLARIAEREELSATSICIFCGETMEKDLEAMLEHAKGCEKRPENRLMERIAELEEENERRAVCGNCKHFAAEEFQYCNHPSTLDAGWDGDRPYYISAPDKCDFTPSRWDKRGMK